MSTAHVVVPAGFDDPARPSGGNGYDQRVVAGLRELGWSVHLHAVAGTWPHPDDAARAGTAHALAAVPDGEVVLVDGLVASPQPDVLGPAARRLRLVVLVHMPLGEGRGADEQSRTRERAVLGAAAAVVTTSRWTRTRLIARYDLSGDLVHVAEPGVDPAAVAPGTPEGRELLCVAAVAPHKGHEVLLDALSSLRDLAWRCALVGRLDVDPAFARRVQHRAVESRLAERLRVTGPLAGDALGRAYAEADLLVLPSYAETYGMVVTEALARGLPVIASCVGGVPEALGRTTSGSRPGLLVPPGDTTALAEALRCWLTEPGFRDRLRAAAGQRRPSLRGWPETALEVAKALESAA